MVTPYRTQPCSGVNRPSKLIFLIVGSSTEMIVPPLMSSSTAPWKARNAASVTTNDGMPIFATSRPMTHPITTPVTTRAEDRDVPGQAVRGQQDRQDRRADAAGVAGGQVDLAEQQHEDQAHRDDGDGGALDAAGWRCWPR